MVYSEFLEQSINHLHLIEKNFQQNSCIPVHLISIARPYLQILTKYKLCYDITLLQCSKTLSLPGKSINKNHIRIFVVLMV